jgi:hypothetical protein
MSLSRSSMAVGTKPLTYILVQKNHCVRVKLAGKYSYIGQSPVLCCRNISLVTYLKLPPPPPLTKICVHHHHSDCIPMKIDFQCTVT